MKRNGGSVKRLRTNGTTRRVKDVPNADRDGQRSINIDRSTSKRSIRTRIVNENNMMRAPACRKTRSEEGTCSERI